MSMWHGIPFLVNHMEVISSLKKKKYGFFSDSNCFELFSKKYERQSKRSYLKQGNPSPTITLIFIKVCISIKREITLERQMELFCL